MAAALAAILSLAGCGSSIHLPSPDGDVSVAQNGSITFRTEDAKNSYAPVFTIIRTPRDPELKMRPAGIGNVLYNAATWRSENGDARRVERTDDQVGDGFDASILEGAVESRTFSLFNVGENIEMRPSGAVADGTKIRFTYPEHALFALEAELSIDSDSGCPMLSCTLRPKADGWYSVGFTGYEAADTAHVTELWQPMIWQERRFPDRSYATLAFRCPVPSAFVTTDGAASWPIPQNFPSIRCPRQRTAASALHSAPPTAKPHRCSSPPFRAVRSQRWRQGTPIVSALCYSPARETRPTPYSVPPSASTPSATCAATTFRRSTAPSPTSSATR